MEVQTHTQILLRHSVSPAPIQKLTNCLQLNEHEDIRKYGYWLSTLKDL